MYYFFGYLYFSISVLSLLICLFCVNKLYLTYYIIIGIININFFDFIEYFFYFSQLCIVVSSRLFDIFFYIFFFFVYSLQQNDIFSINGGLCNPDIFFNCFWLIYIKIYEFFIFIFQPLCSAFSVSIQTCFKCLFVFFLIVFIRVTVPKLKLENITKLG